MPTFVEYELENGATLLIELGVVEQRGVIQVSRTSGENVIIKSNKKFRDALNSCKEQAKLFIKEIEDLHVDEAEIKFGLTTTGELGNMAIGKIGVDVNYEITLKWKSSNRQRK